MPKHLTMARKIANYKYKNKLVNFLINYYIDYKQVVCICILFTFPLFTFYLTLIKIISDLYVVQKGKLLQLWTANIVKTN
jgi:hypothetical protein